MVNTGRCALGTLATLLLVAAGCGTGGEVTVVAAPTTETAPGDAADTADDPGPAPDPTPTVEPGTAPDEPRPTAVPGTRPVPSTIEEFLLDERDLGGFGLTGPMPFADEPVFEFVDCDLMDDLWLAHLGSGQRIRSEIGDSRLRHFAVDVEDETAAAAMMDAVEAVWLDCNPLYTTDGSPWWVEPLGVPDVDGWRSAGVAFGIGESLWTITWFQQGTSVVVAEVEGERPWDVRNEVDLAIAARLRGDFDPIEIVPVLEQAPTPTQPPVETPTPVPTPSPTPMDLSWLEHPAAIYLPDPSFFGEGWTWDLDEITEAGPPDPDDTIDDCDVEPPPTMEGLAVEYEAPDFVSAAFVIVGIGDAAAASASIDAFRFVTECPPDSLDGDEVVLLDVGDGAADDTVVFEVLSESYVLRYALGRYGQDLIGVALFVRADAADGLPSPSEMVGWLDGFVAAAE